MDEPRVAELLRGPMVEPRVDELLCGPMVEPCVDELLRGPMFEPRIADILRGPTVEPRVAEYLREWADIPHVAGGLVGDPRKYIIATYHQEFPQDQTLSLKNLIVVLHSPLSLKSLRHGIG
jgi:hypothetical protein